LVLKRPLGFARKLVGLRHFGAERVDGIMVAHQHGAQALHLGALFEVAQELVLGRVFLRPAVFPWKL